VQPPEASDCDFHRSPWNIDEAPVIDEFVKLIAYISTNCPSVGYGAFNSPQSVVSIKILVPEPLESIGFKTQVGWQRMNFSFKKAEDIHLCLGG